MSDKKRWLIFAACSVLVAAGLGTLLYYQHQGILERRQEVAALKKTIEESRALLEKTPELVKQVIIQRETDGVIKEILSDEQDLNNLSRALTQFCEESGIAFSSIKKQKDAKKSKEEFERVGYALSFDADAFQLLSFLHRVESHARFISVTGFKLTAANRSDYAEQEVPRHRVTLDLETYVYAPTGTSKEVKIDHYDKKRDLLISEISKRAAELRFKPYDYKGQRGRRDPWIDPRVPVDGGPQLSIEEQIAIVDELIEQADAIQKIWEQARNPEISLLETMKLRADLEEKLALIEEGIRRVQTEGQLVFIPALRRFDKNVVAVVDGVREQMSSGEGGSGPSTALLRETAEAMERHIGLQEYELALQAFATIEQRLPLAEHDPLKQPLVESIRALKHLSDTVLAFEAIELNIQGTALYEERPPVALINGQAVSEGEILGDELIVHNIRTDQIEFAFRGLVLARSVEPAPAANP
jgi:Tfp pilus assembly protein PilO